MHERDVSGHPGVSRSQSHPLRAAVAPAQVDDDARARDPPVERTCGQRSGERREEVDDPGAVTLDDGLEESSGEAEELVTVWAQAPELPVRAPSRRLAGWRRVRLEPGETQEVSISIGIGVLAVWDAACEGDTSTPGAFRVQPGVYRIVAGPSATDSPVQARFTVTGEMPSARRLPLLAAHGFHLHEGIATSDRTSTAGHSIEVHPDAELGAAEYHRIDPSGVHRLTLTVARRSRPSPQPASIVLQFRPDGTDEWTAATGTLPVDSEGPYDWRAIRIDAAELRSGFLAGGPGDLRVVLTGAARLAEIAFGS